MTVSARRSASSPYGAWMVNPVSVVIGDGAAPHTMNRYHGIPKSADRSIPNTSQATANSKGDRSLDTTTATVWRRRRPLAESFCTWAIMPLLGPAQRTYDTDMFSVYCPRH